MTNFKTCKHCSSIFKIEVDNWDSNSHLIDHPEVYCPMCNMNALGDEEKEKKK